MPVYSNINGKLNKLTSISLDKEKALQKLIEENLLEVLEMDFIATEYRTTANGRIDTLAIDAHGCPVIIEYKRNKNDNVINQALFYLKWLKTQKVEFFEMLVIKKLGTEKEIKIDWKNPEVICIAESYNKYDIDALEEISANLELYRYNYYNNIFTLENVKGDDEKVKNEEQIVINKSTNTPVTVPVSATLEKHLNKGQPFVTDLFLILKHRIIELDEAIQEKINNNYIAFKISKMFAEVHIQKNKLMLYLRPIQYNDPEGRIYKVPDSYNWVLDRRVYISKAEDIDYVMNLVEQSYKDIL